MYATFRQAWFKNITITHLIRVSRPKASIALGSFLGKGIKQVKSKMEDYKHLRERPGGGDLKQLSHFGFRPQNDTVAN